MQTAAVAVAGTDLEETGDEAIRVGLQQLANGAAQGLYVVHVIALDPATLPGQAPERDAHTVQMIAESVALRIDLVAKRAQLPYYEGLVRIEVRKGEVPRALIDAAREHRAELLIVGTHGRTGMDRLLAGSIAETLVRHACCSVLIARPRQPLLKSECEPVEHRSTYRFDPALLAARREERKEGERASSGRPSSPQVS
jgi:nucleotide-binding universal stress UspA family protein